MIKGKSYTFFIASTPGKLRKLIVPAYALHGLAVLALIGMITVVAAAGSTRECWKITTTHCGKQETLKVQYHQLRADERHQPAAGFSASLRRSAVTYGVLRYHPAAFDVSDNPVTAEDAFDRSVSNTRS